MRKVKAKQLRKLASKMLSPEGLEVSSKQIYRQLKRLYTLGLLRVHK